METKVNSFGEKVTRWYSNKHPDNKNFMQVVKWIVWEKPDGKIIVGYNLGCGYKTKFLYGLTKEEAIKKYTD